MTCGSTSSVTRTVEVTSNLHPESGMGGTHQVSVEHPVGMEVVDSIQDLVQQRLHHALGHLHRVLLASLDRTVVLDDVLRRKEDCANKADIHVSWYTCLIQFSFLECNWRQEQPENATWILWVE